MLIYGITPAPESEQSIKERRTRIKIELRFIAEQKQKLSTALDARNKSEIMRVVNLIDDTLSRIRKILGS